METIKGKYRTDCSLCQFREKFHCMNCLWQGGSIFWGECDIYKCATAKGHPHCGLCRALPCGELTAFIENGHNPHRLSNLNKWKSEDA